MANMFKFFLHKLVSRLNMIVLICSDPYICFPLVYLKNWLNFKAIFPKEDFLQWWRIAKNKNLLNGPKVKRGELELAMVTYLEPVCYFTPENKTSYDKVVTYNNTEAVTIYKPVSIPDGFFALGHCNQNTRKQHRGAYILVARPRGDNTPLNLPLTSLSRYSFSTTFSFGNPSLPWVIVL